MKFLRLFIVIALIFMLLPQNIVFADGVKVENDLAGINGQKIKLIRPVRSGLYYISFEALAENSSADLFCRLVGSGGGYDASNISNLYDAAAFRTWTRAADKVNQPVFTVFGEMTCDWDMTKPANSMRPYNENEWYDVDIWLDFNKRISTVYLNGEYFDTSKMQDKFTSLYGFTLYCNTKTSEGRYGDNTGTYFKYKNLKYGALSDDYITEEIENVAIPQYLKDSVDVDVTTENPGHIFYTPENIPFNISLKNKSGKSRSYNVSYEAFSNGKSMWKSSETISVSKASTVSKSVSIKLENPENQYGFFDFKVIVTDSETGENFERNTRFSVAKKSDKVNNKVGVNHHYSRRMYEKGMEDALQIFYNAGFGAERDGLGWTGYEISEGKYELSDKTNTWLNSAEEKDSKIVAILGYYNDMYKHLYPEGEVAAPPVDGEYMEKWKLYVENIVRDTIERVSYYEVYNEWNLSHCNNGKEHYTPHPPEDYVKLVKETYQIIDKINKEKGTNVKVLCGALGYNSGNGTNEFISNCMDLGICDYSDGISFHPYWAHENPEDNNYYSTLIAIREIKAELEKRNLNNEELVITELGYPTRENGNVSEMDQAKWMVRSSAYYEGEIELITWYVGEEKIDNTETEKSFGIIRPQMGTEIPFEAKPAYVALANYNSLLAGAELISRSPEINDRIADGSYINNEQYTYHFKNNNKDIYMLVTMDRNGGTLKLKAGNGSKAELIDMYGNSKVIECDENGTYTIAVKNDEPVYVVPIPDSMTVSEVKDIADVYEYSDGFTFYEDSGEDIALGDNEKYFVDLKNTPVSSGIVDVSYRFWPSMSSASPTLNQATQTFEFGDGFSFDANWSSYGGATWIINGYFNVGDQTKRMNPAKWLTDFPNLGSGCFRAKGSNTKEPHAYYDISAKVNLDTNKIKLTIVEHLETKTETKEPTILVDEEYDYTADSFDFYRTSLMAQGNTYLQSLNSGLKIKADGETSYNNVVDSIEYKYSEGYVFRNDSNEYITLKNADKYAVDLKDIPVSEGIVDVSYRFWPNMQSYEATSRQATQVFKFGDGFSFNAQWKSWGDAFWLKEGKFNIGNRTITMNANAWNTGGTAGLFRPTDKNDTAPIAYYDISAKINLDTNKIKLTITEYLETKAETKEPEVIFNDELDYNASLFDGFEQSFTAEGDVCLQSLNSSLLIKADGVVSYREGPKFVSGDMINLRNDKANISDYADFMAAEKPVINITVENAVEDGLNAMIVVAYYNEDVLVKVDKIKDVAVANGNENINYSYIYEKENVQAESVKIFVWNDTGVLIPIKQTTWFK